MGNIKLGERMDNIQQGACQDKANNMPFRICLVISSLGPGGAERVLSQLASYWAALGWDVTLLTFAANDSPVYQSLAPEVSLRQLGLQRQSQGIVDAIRANIRRVMELRRAIRVSRPDAVLSFIDQPNVLTLLATCGLGLTVVVSERVDPAQHPCALPWRVLRSLLYPFAAAVIVQTANVANYFHAAIRRRIVVLPNMVMAPSRGPREWPFLVLGAVGRLEFQKGFDLLITAFAAIAERHPDWRLIIWGEGSERGALQRLADASGAGSHIRFAGLSPKLGSWVNDVDLFVLPSRYEGFPNALGEAMAAGLPVVAFDCPSGPSEIIREGGILVPPQDVAALAATLDRVMGDEGLRQKLAAAARSDMARFAPDLVLRKWTRLMESLMYRAKATDAKFSKRV